MHRCILLLSVLFVLTCHAGSNITLPPSRGPLPAGVREISIEETEKLIRDQKDVPVIDVRSAEEFAEHGHLPRAQLVDFSRMDFVAAVGTLKIDPAKPFIIYCALGGRARRASEKLVKAGYKEILLVKGGFKAWKDAGKSIEGTTRKQAP